MLRFSLACAVALLAACKSSPASAEPPRPRGPPPAVAEVLYAGDLKNGWLDYGWSPRTLGAGPAVVDLSNFGGWILGKPNTQPKYGGLRFKIAGVPEGSFHVRLEGGGKFEKVVPGAAHKVSEAGGFVEYFVPLVAMNPEGKAFEQVVFQGTVKGELKGVRIDEVGLTAFGAGASLPVAAQSAVQLEVDCKAKGSPISPWVYGIAFDVQRHTDDTAVALGATARRWGGNNSSRYNWKLGNAWNAANDWYFMNVNYTGDTGQAWKTFLLQQKRWGMKTALTLPTLGWVSKDVGSAGFPQSEVPTQQGFDPDQKGAGNGRLPSGNPIPPGPPTRTSIAAPPAFIAEWTKEVQGAEGGDTLLMYFLDNEPGLWHETHRDVHPEPLTYDELWQRTRDYAQAVKKAQPQARIAGPAEWGWPGYFDAPSDAGGRLKRMLKTDRRSHGNTPLVEWWLQQLAAQQKKTGERLVDVLDLHYYPQAKGVGNGEHGSVDPATNALRLRTTRALWDPTYKDESWIAEPIALIPRMKKWVADNAPGMDIAIGEYSFGAQQHPSGALAQAEVLGRFGQQGVYAAFAWMYPPKDAAAAQAFQAFRNYDGKGARFLDVSVPATATGLASLFASRSDDGKKYVLVALNLDPDKAAQAPLNLKGCATVKSRRVFQTTFSPKGLEPLEVADFAALPLRPYSITVVELEVAP